MKIGRFLIETFSSKVVINRSILHQEFRIESSKSTIPGGNRPILLIENFETKVVNFSSKIINFDNKWQFLKRILTFRHYRNFALTSFTIQRKIIKQELFDVTTCSRNVPDYWRIILEQNLKPFDEIEIIKRKKLEIIFQELKCG